MSHDLSYEAATVPIRGDLVAAHQRAWRRLAQPGTWWTGAQRVAIAAETRQAVTCRLCQLRQTAVTPYAVSGQHDHLGELSELIIDVIHRVRMDASRLTASWYNQVIDNGLSDAAYVEIVGVIATIIAIDTFTHAMGLAKHPLPSPVAGEPSRYRPDGAKPGMAWVPTIAPEDVVEADQMLYAELSGAHIHRALSLVPAEVLGFFDLDAVQYLPDAALRDFGREYRAITHAQIELLAARVSVLNQCFY
ncbi:MAG: hypothetical protein ETSY2_18150 [Candidatus Entotheonella gemina]|uniref:Uncharacterized protein n=1 Tax=Candidatus Entotheonella gemina TaxID=1429439 RepID=W4M7T8_9BACT|nr:MAG: hypothetical protein ETSY2_18150 [Candidatus Entotheonella gemina]